MSQPDTQQSDGIWHKDGPLGQIAAMARWAETEAAKPFPNRETVGKIARNLDAAVVAMTGDPS
jgi:hypothetical protein